MPDPPRKPRNPHQPSATDDAAPPPAPGPDARPNVLWVCTDSQRWDTLGCAGNPWVHTPHLDALAAGGVRFTHAFSQSPLCMPSRGSFLTGRYPVTNRLRQNGQTCPPDLRPLPRDLRDAGYVCGLVGKLHLNPCDNRLALGPEWWKHDRRDWFRGAERRIDDGYDVFEWDHAGRSDDPASAYARWLRGRGVSVPLDKPARADSGHVLVGAPVEHHHTTWAADRAASFIEGYAGYPYPWMLSLNLFDPHFVFDPPAEMLEPYLDRLDDIPLPVEHDRDPASHPPARRRWAERDAGRSDRDHRLVRAAYWAMVDLIDVQVGRLLDTLDRTGQRANTLVIFTSDHGEMLGDHGLYKKGPALFDPAVRVPLILSQPGTLPAGLVVDELVELTGLVPTLREACGMDPDPAVQGRSLMPLIRGGADEGGEVTNGAAAPRDDVYAEYLNANPDKSPAYLTMVRTADAKLVRHHGTDAGELYDLAADPDEARNLWEDPAAASLKLGMLVRLTDRQALTADPMPRRVGVF